MDSIKGTSKPQSAGDASIASYYRDNHIMCMALAYASVAISNLPYHLQDRSDARDMERLLVGFAGSQAGHYQARAEHKLFGKGLNPWALTKEQLTAAVFPDFRPRFAECDSDDLMPF